MRWVKLLLLTLLLPATTALAQTGKIAGVITEAATGNPIPGANVVIEGTTIGSITDIDGYYVILNVRPGTYNVRASFIGFRSELRQEVRVNVDLTTEIDFSLQEENVELGELVVAAERPVVQRDVSASVANITAEEIENLPVTDIDKVVGLQAGFERGLTIRGEGGDQVQFMVDGMSMASGRNNTPFTGVSYTAVQEVAVQTGGFNAEYGNVRSGLINVITKEPEGNRFSVDAIVRYSGASPKNIAGVDVDGNEVEGPWAMNTFLLRPMYSELPEDQQVVMNGVSEANGWDEWQQASYRSWTGWNAIAEAYNSSNGTNFSGADIQNVFREHFLRKDLQVDAPEYELDATLGGPVPGLHQLLGDLRFLVSYRQTETAYGMGGNAREAFTERIGQGKLISNFAPGMKLVINGLYAVQQGLNRSEQGDPNLTTGELPTYPWDGGTSSVFTQIGNTNSDRALGEYYSDMPWQLMDIDRFMVGAQFTHTLNSRTFYEVQLQSITTDYYTRAIDHRRSLDELNFSYLGGTLVVDEAPFGYTQKDGTDPFAAGMIVGGHWGSGYDNSSVQRFSGRFDITSQLNRYSLVKAGVEYIYSDYNTDYGEDDPEHPHNGDPKWKWNRQPQQAAAYIQDKLEFRGMIANIGLRLDYFHAGGDWYVYDEYDRAFSASFGVDALDETLSQEPTERQVALSPRLGVSFPVTDNSKLYFNYGHFRQMLNPQSLFNIQQDFTGAVRGIGNPNHPMPRTVAYELGFEQNLFDQYLLRVAGYYRDLRDQPRGVTFISLDDLVNYNVPQPWNYSDVRGLEFTLSRNRGEWIRGFVNYTYSVRKAGNFGFSQFDENTTAQRNFVLSTTEHYASKPIPEPYARFNVEVRLPDDIGPAVGETHLLGDWRINFLGEWRKGLAMTWNGQSLGNATGGSNDRDLQGNVRWKDYYMLDMRLSKNFGTRFGDAQFFVDFNNVLNIRHMYIAGGRLWENGNNDQLNYMRSLHLPDDTFPEDINPGYAYVRGNDRPGDFRKPGVAFVPIVAGPLPETGHERALYYVPDESGTSGSYFEWNGNSFVQANQGRVDQVLDDKAYIDMPNHTHSTFLNPRNIFFGLRLSF